MDALLSLRIIGLASGILLGASLVFSRDSVLGRHQGQLLWLTLAGVAWVVFGEPLFNGWQQYLAWAGSSDPRLNALLSENPTYIYIYTWGRYLAWRVIGFVAAVFIYWLSMRFVVKPSEGMKLNKDEALLIAIGIALAGWPGFILYLLALLLLYASTLAIRTADRGSEEARFPVALPATLALVTIPFIQHLLVWLSNTFEINFLLLNVTSLSI